MKNNNYKTIEYIAENSSKDILNNYDFTEIDALQLLKIKELVYKYEDSLLEEFYKFIFSFNHAKRFLHNQEILHRHEKGIRAWYRNLFCGKYDTNYFYKLNIISEVHVRIGLPTHYVNAAFSFVRRFIKDKLIYDKKYEALSAFDKIIDINLDILTISYQDEEQTKLIDEIILLKLAVESNSIEPYIQAIYNSKTIEVEKYECLMRIINPNTLEVKSIFPYLDISKKIKLYEKMMSIMVEKSLSYFSTQNIEFSLNLSYEDIANKPFRNFIYKKVKSFPYPHNIIFEILETDFIEDFSIVEAFVNKVRLFGCQIAIDDFGSGFSSMENILKLNPEIIKIDGSLIKSIHTSEESKTIVRNIINMAKELNAKTVAEYVHCKEVYDIILQLKVDFIQGFYLAEPKCLK
ncbi:MAG: EAL domain-containing protein [Arcobacter sp.]|uniref:EAL domain-containing protein n=1 Tax=Arcobacter sp. TaxID=1872629 RepID=UPI003B007F18